MVAAGLLCGAACSADPSEPAPGLPCDVSDVLETSCQPCHSSPTQYGAPMPLVTLEDTRAPFTALPDYDHVPVWQLIGEVVERGWMPQPLPGVTLSAEGRATLLDWVANEAPPSEPGEGCP